MWSDPLRESFCLTVNYAKKHHLIIKTIGQQIHRGGDYVKLVHEGSRKWSGLWNSTNLLLHCSCSVAELCLILVTSWTAAHQAPLSFTISRGLLKLGHVNQRTGCSRWKQAFQRFQTRSWPWEKAEKPFCILPFSFRPPLSSSPLSPHPPDSVSLCIPSFMSFRGRALPAPWTGRVTEFPRSLILSPNSAPENLRI